VRRRSRTYSETSRASNAWTDDDNDERDSVTESESIDDVNIALHHTDDIKCLSFSEGQKVIVTGGQDKAICIWDFCLKKPRLRTKLPDHPGEITSVCVIGDLPAFAASDSIGNVYMYVMKPHSQAVICASVTSICEDNGNGQVHRSDYGVTTMSYHTREQMLVAGDERGYVRIWKLTEFLDNISLFTHGRKTMKSHPGSATNRKDNSFVTSMANHSGQPKESRPGTATTTPHVETFDLQVRFRAHTESISAMIIVDEPATIVTASFDCQVRLWDFGGHSRGGLHQSPLSDNDDPWLFQVNDSQKRQKEAEAVREVILEIAEKEEL
jgi:WD40 repeat protein